MIFFYSIYHLHHNVLHGSDDAVAMLRTGGRGMVGCVLCEGRKRRASASAGGHRFTRRVRRHASNWRANDAAPLVVDPRPAERRAGHAAISVPSAGIGNRRRQRDSVGFQLGCVEQHARDSMQHCAVQRYYVRCRGAVEGPGRPAGTHSHGVVCNCVAFSAFGLEGC